MDGLTKVLFVEAPVKKGEVNHIKMAIADAGDWLGIQMYLLKQKVSSISQ